MMCKRTHPNTISLLKSCKGRLQVNIKANVHKKFISQIHGVNEKLFIAEMESIDW